MKRCERNDALVERDEYVSEYSYLSRARDTQDEYLENVQREVEAARKKGTTFEF